MQPQPKPPSRAAEKRDKSKAKLEAYRKVCYLVSRRDLYRCRCCNRPATHHHHLRFRSKGGQDTTRNVLLLCAECHADIHAHRLYISGDNADKTLRFWRADSE